jgi:succinate dehydrogenase/fumarate reductase-like Fe-S protein
MVLNSLIVPMQEFFVERKVVLEIERCLENMGKISNTFNQWDPHDSSLRDAHIRATAQWEGTSRKVDTISQQLQQIPTQWKNYQQK